MIHVFVASWLKLTKSVYIQHDKQWPDSDRQTKIELCASVTQRYMKYISGVFRILERGAIPSHLRQESCRSLDMFKRARSI